MRGERQYVIDTIGAFLNGSGGEWDWDDFTSISLRSAKLDNIRRQAGVIDLPLDAEGEAILKTLLNETALLTGDDLTKPKPWHMKVGIVYGLLAGASLWWSGYVPGAGLFQNPQLIVLPAVIGILIVTTRNKWNKTGPYDPKIVAQNKRGRV